MGDKYASRVGGASSGLLVRNKLKFLIPASLLLMFVVWNSSSLSPLDAASSPPADGGASEALNSHTTLQHKAGNNVQVGQSINEVLESEAEAITAEHHNLTRVIPMQITREETHASENATVEEAQSQTEEPPAQTEELRDAEARREASRNINSGRLEEEEAALATIKEEEAKSVAPLSEITGIDPEMLPFILGNKTHLAGTDLWKLGEQGGDLKFLEETIRSVMLPYTTRKDPKADASCEGRNVYVYDLPPEFNEELVARCEGLFPWFSLCPYVTESGRGVPVNAVENGTQIFVPGDCWFNTHQYALEMISHARILKYKCLTEDREKADLFYIPFYAGLDVIRWHFDKNVSNVNRDVLSLKLISLLNQQGSFKKRNGFDHVLVLGKISWDFRRTPDNSWGSTLLRIPELRPVTRVIIERDPWARNDIGVPHPTYFHPKSAGDIDRWLGHVRSQKRPHLVTFVGKERRNDPRNPRTALVKQCKAAASEDDCKFVECNGELCLNPAFVTNAFLATDFCMQPPGDSATRRSVFDSLIAGCIPVLFHPSTAYLQYPWHLPRNESSWSVYISEEDVIKGTVSVVDTLKKISVEQRDAMRDLIINTIIPGLLYSAPGADVYPYRDAFDITLDQLLYRVKHISQLDLSD